MQIGPCYSTLTPHAVEASCLPRHHHPRRPPGRPRRPRRRRPGQHRRHRHEVERHQGARAQGRQGAGRLRRLGRPTRSRSSRSSRRSSSATRATCRAPRWSWPRTGGATGCCGGSRRCSSWPTWSTAYLLSGSGELIEPDDGVLAIGSGGNYALAAARALLAEHRACRPARSCSSRWRSPPTSASTPTATSRSSNSAPEAPPLSRPHDAACPNCPSTRPARRPAGAAVARGAAAAPDRRGAGSLHRRPGGGQEGGRDRAAQPLAPGRRRPTTSATRSRRTTSS